MFKGPERALKHDCDGAHGSSRVVSRGLRKNAKSNKKGSPVCLLRVYLGTSLSRALYCHDDRTIRSSFISKQDKNVETVVSVTKLSQSHRDKFVYSVE